MNLLRFSPIASRYLSLRLAVIGDFCLDRYLDIGPARAGTSIETGLPVHNVGSTRYATSSVNNLNFVHHLLAELRREA